MARSNRQRKRDRAVRQAKAARKRDASRHRQLIDTATRQAQELLDRIYDPQTPAAELASLLADFYDGEPVIPGIAEVLLAKGASPERLVTVSEALRAADEAPDGEPSLTYLTFAAAAARAAGDLGQARRLLDDAVRQAGDPRARGRVTGHLLAHGRLADAIELLEARLRDDPGDPGAAEQYGAALGEAFARVSGEEPSGSCPCGRGLPWPDCCAARERAALDRFTDPSALAALRDALSSFLAGPGSEYGRAVGDQVAEWLSFAEVDDWDPAERAVYSALAAEVALATAGTSASEPAQAGPGDAEDDRDNALAAFAADPRVPPESGAAALTWRDHIHYGLWQVAEPGSAPGWWCTDIATGVTRYAAVPAEITRQFPRWGVLLGGLVPVDGVWRSTGQAWQLSPAEADALAETILRATETVVRDLVGRPAKRAARRTRQPVPFGQTPPHGVLAYWDEEMAPESARLMSMVTSSLLPRLIAEVHEHRAAPPFMSNTDGDPMCLIRARIAVHDAGTLAGRLAARPDFSRDPADPAQLSWLGREIPAGQRAAMLADVQAELHARGLGGVDVESAEGPRRWVQGQLEVRGGELVAEVNSRNRLTRLLGLLTRLGEAPAVIDETRVDPAQDMAWPAGPRIFPGGAAPPEEGWEKHWLDEPVPALRGRTPRQAAQSSSEDRPALEALLRQFEYEACLLAADGKSGAGTAWLRRELGMDGDPWE